MKYYPIIIVLSVLSIQSFAQTTHFIHYGIEHGLPQSQVQTIEQDNDGNLWIGTMSGLSKYNGREFINYTKKDGLAEDWITASFKDKAGNLWLGHWGGGVTFYNYRDNAFKNLDFDIFSDFKTITANRKMLNFAASGAGSNLGKIQSDAGTMSKKSGVKILYLSASGATAGPGTYIDAAIRRAGGINIMTTPGWHTPDIEALVGLEPDLVITSFFKDGYASVNGAGLNNKVLQDKISKTAHVNVPGKLWPCAGPGLYAATDIIAKAVEGLR